MTMINERLATLEEKASTAEEQRKALEEKLDAYQTAVMEQIAAVRADLTRYKGMFGGIMLTLSAIGALITIALGPLAKLFGKAE